MLEVDDLYSENINQEKQNILDQINKKQQEINAFKQSLPKQIVFKEDCPYKKIYLDTIPYQIWDTKQAQFQSLHSRYSMLPQTIPDPVQEKKKKIVTSQNTQTGQTNIIQKKQDPFCSWYFPMDCTAMFGVSFLGNLIPPLCTIKSYYYVNDDPKNGYVYKAEMVPIKDKNNQIIGSRLEVVPFFQQLQVALDKGYAYVPNGISFNLQYIGIPLTPDAVLIPGVGPTYGAILGGFYKPATLKDKNIIQRFPYQNVDPEGSYFWLQTSFVSPGDIANLATSLIQGPPLIVKFTIYIKYKLPCGYPKEKDLSKLTDQEIKNNGVCGLQQFFSKPIVVDRKRFKSKRTIEK